MTVVNPFRSIWEGYKAGVETTIENLENTGEIIGSIFDGNWQGAKDEISDYKLPFVEQYKTQKADLEKQENEEGRKTILDVIKGWLS